MTSYLLERGGVRLGRLPLRARESFAIRCGFEPTPAFEPYRALFEEDAALAQRIAHDDDPALLEKAEELLERILALGFKIRREGGGRSHAVLLGIEGDTASFRSLDPQEEFL